MRILKVQLTSMRLKRKHFLIDLLIQSRKALYQEEKKDGVSSHHKPILSSKHFKEKISKELCRKKEQDKNLLVNFHKKKVKTKVEKEFYKTLMIT
jgi:hypothetical protein